MTAESMMRDQAAAGLYAPLRVVLYEEPGGSVFAYDRPSDLLGQFGAQRAPQADERATHGWLATSEAGRRQDRPRPGWRWERRSIRMERRAFRATERTMASEETRRLLKAFGIAVTDYEEALARSASAEELARADAEMRTRMQQVVDLIDRLRARATPRST